MAVFGSVAASIGHVSTDLRCDRPTAPSLEQSIQKRGLRGQTDLVRIFDGDSVVQRRFAWAQRSGATSLEDVVTYEFVDDFVAALALKPVPERKLRAALRGEAVSPPTGSRT